MAPPKDIARSYPKRGITADVGFRSEPAFVGDGSVEYVGTNGLQFDGDHTFVNGFSVAGWYWVDGTQFYNYAGFAGTTLAWGFLNSGTNLNFYQKATATGHQTAVGTLTPKQWNHIAFTLSQDGLTVKAYLNGVELTIGQPSVAIVLPSLTSITQAGIASFQSAASGASLTLPYSGLMANQIWYDGVLTQDEVRQLMRAPNYAVASTIVTPQFYFELFSGITDSTGNATTVEDRGTTTTAYGVNRPQLPRGLDLARGAAMARVYTGRAVDFDGSADRLTAAHYNPSGDYLTTTAWVNADTLRGQGIVHNGNTGRNSFLFYMGGAGSLIFFWNDTTGDAYILHQTPLKAGQWHHLAMVLDMSDPADHQVACYIDGIAATGTRASGSWVGDNTYQFGNQYGTTGWFDGKIADCRIYDVALTQAQVRELYHNPEQVLPTGVSASNLRRYYPLSDYNDTGGTGGRYFQDMGADGEPAEDKGSANMAFAQPVPCPQLGLQQSASRIYFDGVGGGSTGPYWSANLSTAPGATFSLAYWIWYDSSLPIYSMVTEGGGQHYIQTAGNIIWYDGGGTASFNGAFPSSKQDRWTHVVMTSTASSPYAKCYVDGVEQTASGAAGGAGMTATSFSVFARAATTVGFHKGFCANMAIFDDALSSAEVTELFNQGIGYDLRNDTGDYASSAELLNYWLFDDLTSVVDRKGSNNLTNPTSTAFSGMASFPENASGSTIVGDFSMKRKGVSVLNPTATPLVTGVMPGAQIANDGSLNIDPANGGHTVSFFIRVEMGSASGGMMLAPAAGTSGANWHFCYFTSTINAVPPRLQIGDGATTYRDYIWPAAITNPEEWHQLAYTVDFSTSPTTFRLYLDGALVSTQAAYTHLAIDSGDVMHVGNNSSGTLNFPGAIACVKMYQTKLSDDEVEQIYRSDLRLIKGLANE